MTHAEHLAEVTATVQLMPHVTSIERKKVIEAVMKKTVEVGLYKNCPYIIYWQLYCNEFLNPDAVAPVTLNSDMRGFWLIKPDGTKSWHYDYLKEMCNVQ